MRELRAGVGDVRSGDLRLSPQYIDLAPAGSNLLDTALQSLSTDIDALLTLATTSEEKIETPDALRGVMPDVIRLAESIAEEARRAHTLSEVADELWDNVFRLKVVNLSESGQHQTRDLTDRATYDEVIQGARDLLVETLRDPVHEGHPEYVRGVVNLIAEVFGRSGVFTDDRMDEVADNIGLHGPNGERWQF